VKLSDLAHGHDNNFNLLRFLAAFAVLFSHSYSLVLGVDPIREPFTQRIHFTLGGVAVDVFFVISGFLVTASLLRLDDFKEFFRARALRILPALLPMALLLACVLGPVFTSEPLGRYFAHGDVYTFIFKNATIVAGLQFTLPGVFEHAPFPGTVNGSLWSLPLEIRCYLGIALLGFLVRRFAGGSARRFTGWMVALALFLLVAFWALHESSRWQALNRTTDFRLFYMFASGAAFHALRECIRMEHWIAVSLAAALAAVVAFAPGCFFWIYPLVVGYLVLYAAYVPGGVLRQFNRLGDYSYGIYIYAFPVQQALVAASPGISVGELIAGASAATLVPAVLSWHLVEKPALRRKSRRALEFDRTPELPALRQGEAASP
jgi:peptidoglycan/LPS O-acetylase OafA/YrhL